MSNKPPIENVNTPKVVIPQGDDVDLSLPLAEKPLFVKVDEAAWRNMGVGNETIKMVKMVGLVKNLLL